LPVLAPNLDLKVRFSLRFGQLIIYRPDGGSKHWFRDEDFCTRRVWTALPASVGLRRGEGRDPDAVADFQA